ncbi:hypothetical protein Nepgr_000973 [Nepenthes gracilis]|uniref:Uncharacterized protein n=1 Tax=Nepenthes gracilis TaxID=150966 RepID=A0AAD3RWL4_NEPGR|nr:hypothetical protein Nepgr_000973 [Nepenthes gracilis]
MASVADIASVLRESDVKVLCVEFNVPKEIAWRVPGRNDRAFAPLVGHITVYEAHLRSGLRLPLSDDLQSVLRALRINTAIYDSLKNWKNRFFFVSVGATWPLAKDWGQVPEAYTGTLFVAEVAALE